MYIVVSVGASACTLMRFSHVTGVRQSTSSSFRGETSRLGTNVSTSFCIYTQISAKCIYCIKTSLLATENETLLIENRAILAHPISISYHHSHLDACFLLSMLVERAVDINLLYKLSPSLRTFHQFVNDQLKRP